MTLRIGDAGIATALAERGYAVVDGFFSAAQTLDLEGDGRRLWGSGGFRPSGVGRGPSFRLAPEVRSDRVRWLVPPGETRAQRRFFSRMDALRRRLNRELYLGLDAFEAHYALYPPGAFYRTHRDRFADSPHRIVSAITYLNHDWMPGEGGGELRLYLGEADAPPFEDVAPEAGRLVCFMSERFPHEVRPAGRERLGLTGWFTARP